MRIMAWCVAACAASALGLAGEAPPKLRLHIPFDGTVDAAVSPVGALKTAYIHVAYHPGKQGQAAQIGSERYPCGLVVRAPSLFHKDKGSLELWYKPLWNPADRAEQARTRTLVTDEKYALDVGHFWLTIARNAVHFAWRGRSAEGLSAPFRKWHKGTWHHIAVTWDGTKGLALYLDGDQAAQRSLRWRLPPSDTLYIAANRRGLNPADGLLDDLRLYDRALSPAEVELAYIHNLRAARAPTAAPREAGPPTPAKPRLTLHLPFDGSVEPATAAGKAKPAIADGVEFTDGLLGKALVCKKGTKLAYPAEKNLSKEAGAITFWTRSAFAAAGERGVFLADEHPSPDDPDKPVNTFVVWLARAGLPTLRADMLPATLQRSLFRWNNMDWHHIALCWRRGDELTLYVNGELAARRAGQAAAWPVEAPKLLHVGSWQGTLPADAVIDDLRVYDAPLSPRQAREQAAQFVLPLTLQFRRTLLERGQATELVAEFHNTSDHKLTLPLTLRLTDPTGKQIASTAVKVDTAGRGKTEVRIPLRADALSTDGLYRASTSTPKRINPPLSYFLVVPPMAEVPATAGQARPKPRLKHLETIACDEVTDAERFCDTGRARIKRPNLGNYREAGPYPTDRFAYKFSVDAPEKLHLAVVAYPHDAPRSAGIVLSSKGFPNTPDVATGYFTDDAPPERMRELPIYFWPREAENALLFRTLELGRPAACGSIALHRVEGGLPPARLDAAPDGGRAIGLWWREPAVPVQFGARSLLAPDIFRSFQRLTAYLRFTGQNLLCYPVAWQAGLLYPSPAERYRLGPGADRHCNDWVDYVLYLCQRQGIRFLPELVLADTFALADVYGEHTAETVAAGTPTARMVLWDGSLTRGGVHEPPRYTPAHAAVRAAVLERIDELGQRYGRSPALEGVALHVGQSHFAWFGSIQCGYGDATLAQFQKDTGIKVPADAKGAARFSQRARWLLTHKQEAWVAWRCRTVHALLAEAARRLTKHRADLRLYLTLAAPDAATWNPLFNLSGWPRTRSLDQMYREGGVDLALCAKIPNLVVRRLLSPTDFRYLLYQHGGGGPNPHPALARDAQVLTEAHAPFRACPVRGTVCSYRAFESAIGRAQPMKGFWWTPPAFRATQPTPAGRAFLAPLARAVAELDVTTLAVGGTTLVTMGHEHEVRDFARVFRALPRRPFRDVPGMADPVCARVLRDGDAHFLYLVNRMGFGVEACVAFEPAAVVVVDLAAGSRVELPAVQAKPLPAPMPKGFVSEHALPAEPGPLPGEAGTQPVTGALLQVELAPYELRAYRVVTQGARLVYAASRAPVDRRVRLAQRLESARSLLEHSKAGPEALKAASQTLKLAERAWRKRELARTTDLLNSYPIERLR